MNHPRHVRWTPDMDAVVRCQYLTQTDAQIARTLGIQTQSVANRRRKLGLVLPEAERQRRKTEHCFRAGQAVWNAGLKGWQSGGRSAETWFKKGQRPPKALPVGSVVERFHAGENRFRKYITVEGGKMRPYNRHVWEAAHGPIPPGHVIWHRDGDALNCEINNLELISRKEGRRRTAPSVNLTDGAVALYLTGGKKTTPEARAAVLACPPLIEAQRHVYQLKRALKIAEQP